MSMTGSGLPGGDATVNAGVTIALLAIDAAVSLFKKALADSGMTADEAKAHADTIDAQNLDELKALLAK